MYAHHFQSGGHYYQQHEIQSVLEPGSDGDCAVILYIREYQPSWKMIPCGKQLSRNWICKRPTRAYTAIERLDYPSLWCRGRCLLVDDICYEYKLMPKFGNGSVGCSVHDAYLSYLDQHFTTYGINIILIIGCNHIKICEDISYGPLDLKGVNTTYKLPNEKLLELSKNNLEFAICDPTMQQCDDGSCRSQSLICMFDFECASHLCACRVGNQWNYSIGYCRYQCPAEICTCAPLMFQCTAGGCIPYTHVCDNEDHCADSSDEMCILEEIDTVEKDRFRNEFQFLHSEHSPWCFDFICSSGLCIDVYFVNDLIPDCSDAGDESHSLAIKYQGLHFECEDTQEIPCAPGHSKCFGVNHLCVYDHDNFGHVSYCRDGAHLINCRYIKCTNSFKCPRSYCIPLRKVCDGIDDCYNGEDENSCRRNICPGYLKCREVEFCIHPVEVCDGYRHCPHGDDEKLCDIQGCPAECICLGRGVVCRHMRFTYIPEFAFHDITYLSVGSNNSYLPTFANLSSLSRLMILNLSSSMIINICHGFQEVYMFYASLQIMYLMHNYIDYLSPTCFSKLRSLIMINLQGNPLVSISESAFKDISLRVLVLRNTLLSFVSGLWVDGFNTLETLDIRGVNLNYLKHSVVNSLTELETIYSDDPRLCCILRNIKVCQDHAQNNVTCLRLLSHTVLRQILIFMCITILLFITISVRCVKKLISTNRPLQSFLHNTILINRSLCVLYVLAIVFIDIRQGKLYIFWNKSRSNKLFCQGLHAIITSGMVMANISTSFLDYITYSAVTGISFGEQYVHKKVKTILLLLHFLIITGFSLVTFLPEIHLKPRFTPTHLCGAPLGVSFDYHIGLATTSLFLSIVIIISFAHSLFTYSAILKNAYSSGKRVQTMASTEININQSRLIKLVKSLLHSTAFRCLECLPIVSVVYLNVSGTEISLVTQLILINTSIIFGCFNNTIPSVWYLNFRGRHEWTRYIPIPRKYRRIFLNHWDMVTSHYIGKHCSSKTITFIRSWPNVYKQVSFGSSRCKQLYKARLNCILLTLLTLCVPLSSYWNWFSYLYSWQQLSFAWYCW